MKSLGRFLIKARVFESLASKEPERVQTDTFRWRFRLAKREIYMKVVFLRSLVRSRITSKPAVYVLGDSHAGIFLKRKPFIVHWFGPATAYKLKSPGSTTRSNERLFHILKYIVKDRDKVLMLFGEIDCRVHIYNQYIKRDKRVPMEELIDETVASYGVVLERMKERGIDFYVASVPPAAREGNIFGVPNYPPPEVRCFINRVFNDRLSDSCEKRGYRFIDAYSRVVDSEGFIRTEFSLDDGTHLEPETIKFFEEGLGIRK